METDRRWILTSPTFAISVSLLLFNDFYLKAAFNNSLTGKLSDFAGLFAFTLFCIAIVPRYRRCVCVAIALVFVYWKSSYSQPLLNLWNDFSFVRLSRTVDVTDQIALVVIPVAYKYAGRQVLATPYRWARASLALIAVFAFTATSYSTQYEDYPNKYYFPGSKAALFKKVDDLHLTYFDQPLPDYQKESGTLSFELPASICFESIRVKLQVVEEGNQTVVSIMQLSHGCPEDDGDREKLLAVFEKEFIERLRTGTPQTKHLKANVEVSFSPEPPAQ